MRLPRICRRCASAFVRNCDSGERLSPSWRGAWSRRAGHAVGRAGRPCRGRCKYVHVSSVAASMRLTPLHGLPTLPSTDSGGRPPRMKERRAKRVARFACSERSMAPLYRKHCRTKQKGRGEGRVLFVFFQFVSNPMLLPTVTGKLSNAGRVQMAGPSTAWMPWPSPHGRVYGVSRHLYPSRQTHNNPEPLWLLTLILTLPAAGGPPRVSAAPPHPTRSGSSRRCHQSRSNRSGSSPGTAGGNPRRSNTQAPDTRSRW